MKLPSVSKEDGYQVWQNKCGNYNRDGGPAQIFRDGQQIWRQNGKLYRDDGPAVIYPDGTKWWYREV